jgi:S-layer homology domain
MFKLRLSGTLSVALFAAAVAAGQPRASVDIAAPAVANAFGPDYQTLFIGAAAFQHLSNSSGYEIDWTTDGYLSYTDESFLGVFVAPLQLPAGAEIQMICTYFLDTAPVGTATTYLEAVKVVYGGTGTPLPGVVPVWGPISNDTDAGYNAACSAGSYTFRTYKDVDSDGLEEDVVHRLRVDMTETGDGRLALGAVKVIWRRQVSPAPSAASFADVPASHQFFQFIEALAASGITEGCGGGSYCPDNPLTRGQMAVFLAKALGLHWSY